MDMNTVEHIKHLLNAINGSDAVYDELTNLGCGSDMFVIGNWLEKITK